MDGEAERVWKWGRLTGFRPAGLGFISLWWGSAVLDEWMGQDGGFTGTLGLKVEWKPQRSVSLVFCVLKEKVSQPQSEAFKSHLKTGYADMSLPFVFGSIIWFSFTYHLGCSRWPNKVWHPLQSRSKTLILLTWLYLIYFTRNQSIMEKNETCYFSNVFFFITLRNAFKTLLVCVWVQLSLFLCWKKPTPLVRIDCHLHV